MTGDQIQAALDKKAENARELGLDYEPENTLHWHALNYRTALTQNAQAMFEALEKFVETCIKQKHYKWVSLTDEDKKEYVAQDFGGNRLDAMEWAEKRLKDKNT